MLRSSTLLVLAGIACLQAADAPPPWVFVATGSASHSSGSDFADHDGSLSVDETLYEGRAFWNPRPGLRFGLGVGGGHRDYDSDLLAEGFGLSHRQDQVWARAAALAMVSPHWGAMVQGAYGYGWDSAASASDGRQHQIIAGPVWVRDRDLFILVGVFTQSHIVGDTQVLPIISVDWRIDARWRLEIFDQVDHQSRLSYAMHETLSAGLRLDLQSFDYALASAPAAAIRDQRTQAGAELDWRPFADDRLSLKPFAGLTLKRTITVQDGGGGTLFKDSVDPAPTFGLSLLARW